MKNEYKNGNEDIDNEKLPKSEIDDNDDDSDDSDELNSIILDDERFQKEKKDEIENDKKEKPFGKKFKDTIVKEEKLRKKQIVKNKLKDTFSMKVHSIGYNFMKRFTTLLDFSLNFFILISMIVSIFVGVNYLIDGNWIMVLTSCAIILVLGIVNERIK